MNLKELIDEVNSVLDYNPDLEAYKKQVTRALNRHYLQISGQYPWLFLQKTLDITVYPKVEGSSGVSVDVDATNRRLVTGTGTSFGSHMDGQPITINGYERRIVRAVDATTLYVDSALSTTEVPSSTEDWSIEFIRYYLPSDVGEVLGVVDRENDRGRLRFIDARKEEEHYLDKDHSGDPYVTIEQPFEFVAAPDGAVTASLTGGISALGTQVYEYMYTITEFGKESPPSNVVTITSNPLNNVFLEGLSDLDFATGLYSGRVRKIYRRNQDKGGRFVLIATQDTVSAGTTFNDDGTTAETYESEAYEERGMYQALRMWHTPGSEQTLEARYQSIPRRLQSDQDSPMWPKQFHHLLVYRALQDAAAQHGALNLATMYERRGNDLLKMMRERWLTRTDRDYIRRGFDTKLMNHRDFERWGIPSKS